MSEKKKVPDGKLISEYISVWIMWILIIAAIIVGLASLVNLGVIPLL